MTAGDPADRGAVDPATAALLARLADEGEPAMFAGVVDGDGAVDPAGVAAARDRYRRLLHRTARPVAARPEVVTDAPVPLRVHRPARHTSDAVVVFVHGGGWALGGGDAYDPVARRLADDLGAAEVAVDHRLAPEHPFPAPYDDTLRAVDWVVDHAGAWDADGGRLGLVGDSAGANLAAGAALARRDAGCPATATLLVYPPTDFESGYPSIRAHGDGLFLTRADVLACSGLYLGGASPRGDPRLSPLRTGLAGLGPTIVATAGFDPLRDPGRALVAALRDAGVDVRDREHPALTHGFLGFTGASAACDAAVAALHDELAQVLAA